MKYAEIEKYIGIQSPNYIVENTLILLFCLFCLSHLSAQSNKIAFPHVPNELLIKFKSNTPTDVCQLIHSEVTGLVTKSLSNNTIEHWVLPKEITIKGKRLHSLEEVIAYYSKHPSIEFIEPNYLWTISNDPRPSSNFEKTSNDTHFDKLWGLHNTGQTSGTPDADIDAVEAWDISKTSSNIKIGVIHSGIDWGHPDLVDNIWQNLAEDVDGDGRVLEYINDEWVFDPDDENGIDDDGNGYIDDFVGWDFFNNDNNPYDDHSSGTHIAGIIGAKGDNVEGVVGVTWNVQMAALKFMGGNGSGATSDAIKAIDYARLADFHLTTNSWSNQLYSDALEMAISTANDAGQLFITSAHSSDIDLDTNPYYPASYDLPNIIVATATDHFDNLADFSSYGTTSIDIAAPGENIYSCIPNNSYAFQSGTSSAASYITGAIALIWGRCNNLSASEVKNIILNSVDVLPSLQGKCVSEGRLNLHKALIYNDDICESSEVWPGDTNADGCVDNDDVLTLGVKNGKTGSNRPDASSNWVGQPATDWGDATPDDIDAKHADANGDGLVDISTDGPIISLHYGKKHGNSINSFLDNFDGDATVNSQWDNPATSGNANFTNNNDNIQLSIGLEQLVGNQSDFYGIGFTLDYSAISTGVNLSIANSAMGQENQDLFAFSKDLGGGQMDVAVVRTDGNNISASGSNDPLCQLIFELNGASNEEELHLKFQNIKIIDALGNETTPMLGASTTVVFGDANNGTSGSQIARSNTSLQMLVNATFATDCDNGAIGTATPYGGTAPFTYQWDNGGTTAQTTDLSVGMHRVTITDANQQSLAANIEIFGDCSALPLDLLSFRANPQNNSIQLDWLTANELGITSFDIQRSTNGIDFSTIQTLAAKGKNSTTTAYQIIDQEVVNNQTYYYRIKTNEATKSHFSPIRTARLTDTFKNVIALPNPVKDELTLYLDNTNQEDVQVVIYNQMGQQMDLLTYSPSTISTSLSIDWSTYPKGLYVVTVVQGEQQQVLKIIKE